MLKFLLEGAAEWGLDQGLDAGLGWILNSLGGGENEKSQIDPAVIAQQFANVDSRLDALGQQQYQDCQAVLSAVNRVEGTVLQTSYDLQAQPLTALITKIHTYQNAFNVIAEHLIENGGNVDALPVRDKQAMVEMTSSTDGLPHIIDLIDAYEETTVVPGAHSLIDAYNRILLHNNGFADDGSDSPLTTNIFPSWFVNAAYTQQNALAAAVAQAAYLYTNVDHLTFTFNGNSYGPDPDSIRQVIGDAQRYIQSWSSTFSGERVNKGDQARLPGIGMLPDDTVLDYRNQSKPVLWTDGFVSLNGDPTSPTPYYCANPAPFCYANRYNAAGNVALTALAPPSVSRLPALIAAQSNDATATGWQSLAGWRIPTTSDWTALQAGATGGLSAWGANKRTHIFDSGKITSLYGGRGVDLTIIAPVLVNTGTAAAPSYGVLSSADPSANALTLEPRPIAGPDPENDVAGRLVLARDFTPTTLQTALTVSARKAKKPRLYGKKPNGHRHRRGSRRVHDKKRRGHRHRRGSHRRPKLGLPAPVTYTNPTPCSQPAVYTVPDGAGSIRITATGGAGAQGAGFLNAYNHSNTPPPFYYYAGGRGGVVTQTIPAVAGSKIYVQVGGAGSLPLPLGTRGGSGGAGGVGGGGNGGPSQDGKNSAPDPQAFPDSGAHSGGGGGASGVTSTANCSQWLVVGGGGGGGGAGFVDLQSSWFYNYFSYGGSGGSGCPVGGGPGCAATDASRATINNNGTLGRAGGFPPNNGGAYYRGADGATMQGGPGGPGAPGGGGGGAGGGYYGGGGGGGGGGLAAGGGGAGGASFAIPGPSGAPSYGFGPGTPNQTSNYVAAAAGSVTITPIPKPTPRLTLSASSTQVEWGQPPSLTAKLPADATGIVGFYDSVNGGCEGNKSPGAACQGLGTAQIMNGVATLPAPARALSVGSHVLHASYGGDSHYLPSDSADLTVTVAKASPVMNLHVSGTMLSPGQTIKSIAVTMPADVTGTVVFYNLTHPQDPNGKDIVLGSAPIKNGAAVLQDVQTATQKLAPGPNRIRASYTDDAHYSSGNSNIVVVTKSPS